MLSMTKTIGNRGIMAPSIEDVKTAWSTVATFLTPPKTEEEYELLQTSLDQLEDEIEEGSHLETLLDYLGELLDHYEMSHFQEVADFQEVDIFQKSGPPSKYSDPKLFALNVFQLHLPSQIAKAESPRA